MTLAGRCFLDPAKAAQFEADTSVTTLPPRARSFGFVPGIERLLPGDLLLFKPIRANLVSRSIERAQTSAGFPAGDAAWTHAAVFLHDDIMVEALPIKGVVRSSVYSRIPDHCILVRRNHSIDDRARYLIALRALGMIGGRYSHFGGLRLWLDLLRGLWGDSDLASSRQVIICSQVYFDAYLDTTKRLLAGCSAKTATTPAHLSATADLLDVELSWLRLR